jgi:dipeptidyl aminopeptidase/acylaminoacyl peptidase
MLAPQLGASFERVGMTIALSSLREKLCGPFDEQPGGGFVHHDPRQVPWTRRKGAPIGLTVLAALGVAVSPASAQQVLSVDDYSRWSSISGSRISPHGDWVAYERRSTNTTDPNASLHLVRLDTGEERKIPGGSDAEFSDDSRWVAYLVQPRVRDDQGDRPAAGDPRGAAQEVPGPDSVGRVELLELSTGIVRAWRDIESFTFATGSRHLLLRGARTPEAEHVGVDVLLHEIGTTRDLMLGSVNEAEFTSDGLYLAYTVGAGIRDANGLFVLDVHSGRLTSLDNDARHYSRLTWSEDGAALAVLKGLPVEGQRERENVLLAFPDVQATLSKGRTTENGLRGTSGRITGELSVTLDPMKTVGFPEGWVLSERRGLAWSGDGTRVFFGIKPQVPVVRGDAQGRAGSDRVANVDVWHTRDLRIQSVQMARAESDRNRTFQAAFGISDGRFVQLADSTLSDVDLTSDGLWAVGLDAREYIHDYEPQAADIYRVNAATGERTLMLRGQLSSGGGYGAHVFGISPNGRHFVYWRDDHFHAYDLTRSRSIPITESAPVSFVDLEFDYPGPRPSYGVAGFTSDGESVILQHRFDLWLVSLDGTGSPRNLTNGVGSEREIRFRLVDGSGPRRHAVVDMSEPVLLSAYGEWTKASGFFEVVDGELRELVFEDALFGTPTRAAAADKYLFTRQTFRDFPDLHVSSGRFADYRRVTDANPQQGEYAWGRRILFDFHTSDGVRLQGILGVPDDYAPNERRPMIVNFYEKNSQNLHRYLAPSYLGSLGSIPMEAVSRGFLIMQPDIHLRTGASHSDMLESVEAAVTKVIEMGFADPERIAVHGHSYSGQGAAFVGTRSRMFAAVGMMAGVTDLTSDFSHNWGWSYDTGGSGSNAFRYYLYTQGRQGTNPWDDPELYRFESGRTHVPDAEAPFLIVHGTADPTVAFQEALGFYNAMRFHGKEAVMLAYPGERHSIRRLANRRDLTIRYFQFFEHHLRGAPAPRWMTDGVPFLEKDGTRDPWE